MARVGIYAVRDTVADDIIGGLHLYRHSAAAVRMFTDAITDTGTRLHAHPEDHVLILIGYIDEQGQFYGSADGDVIPFEGPDTIITGKQYLQATQAQQANAKG